MFNKLHYDAISATFKHTRPDGVFDKEVWEKDVRTMATMLRQDNPHFSFPAFYAGCGLERPTKGE